MKKILFFDSWTRGIHNFTPIARELKKKGWCSLLVHRGSWEHDKNRPLEENIDKITCRDISFYKTRFIYQVLKKEKPDLVLILTTNYIMDRAVILAARSLGIKSCFLMHGVRSVTPGAISHQKNHTNNFLKKKRWQKLKIYIEYTLPNYFFSGVMENKTFILRKDPYLLLLKMFLNPTRYIIFPPPSNELHCDLALVWDNAHKELFKKEYGYPNKKIKVVGHPPLDDVYSLIRNPPKYTKNNQFFAQYPLLYNKSYCVYLGSGAVEAGSVGWTEETRIKHLEEVSKICNKSGLELVIKLHPSTKINPIQTYFFDFKYVHVFSQIDLPQLIYWSEAAIGQTSTVNDIAICMGKPLFIPAWGISESKSRIGLTRNALSILCHSPEELVNYLKSPEKKMVNTDKKRKIYMDHFITYTDGKSMDRIVRFITN